MPARPCKPRLSNLCAELNKTSVFWCLQKAFQIEDIQLYYSCPPLKAQIRDFYVQNWVFWCVSKDISNIQKH